jgi:hypothetical protein
MTPTRHFEIHEALSISSSMTTSGSIALVPLVGVAWAECKAIVQAAVEDGIAAGSEARALLNSWRMADGGWRGLTVGCEKP